MKLTTLRLLPTVALLTAGSQGACMVRDVPDDVYAEQVSYAVTDTSMPGAGVDASPGAGPGAGTDGGRTAMPMASSDGQVPVEGGEPTDTPGTPADAECDLSGRWLVSERKVAVGLGVQQASLTWNYLELAQSGDRVTVTKGLVCGTTVQPIGALSATVEMEGCWPNLMTDNPLAGLSGRVTSTGGGCDLQLDRFYWVFGATPADHYRDPSAEMPTLEQEASGGNPGWEDCDQDGRPGATLNVSGIVTGWRAESIRGWSEYGGAFPKNADAFQVPLNWGQTEAVLAVSSEALKATGGKDGNSSLHFAQFARLSDGQVTGASDDALCQEIRALAPQLTPEAHQ